MSAGKITAMRGLRAALRHAAGFLCAAGLVLGALTGVVPGAAQAQTLGPVLFGPYPLTLPNTQPLTYSNGFSATPGPGLVRVSVSAPNALTQASLTFNGSQVMSLADFANGVTQVDKPITLLANNTFSFTVAGARLTTVTLTVYSIVMPVPTALTPSPLALNIGAAGQLTATLSPTPTASGSLSVTSSNTSVATVPSSVSVASGQGTVLVPVTAVAPGSATVTVSANGGSASATVNVNAPPSVSITAPLANTVYNAPATITVTANAADTDGTITKVDFYQGATLIGTATTAPYSVQWANVAAGSYSLTAVATDNQGATTTSAPVPITVNAPPTVSITAPAPNATFNAPATITVTANAADTDGTITKVDFYQGATLIGTATVAPYSVQWANVPVGNYTLTAVATDNNGATTTSAPVPITVKVAVALYFIHPDHLGTPRLIADANQNTVWRWDNQEPFGNDTPNDDPGSTGNHFDFPLRFPGQYADKETNLAYNYFRDYDPATGRYVQPDPVLQNGFPSMWFAVVNAVPSRYLGQIQAQYSYAANAPIFAVDPTGQFLWPLSCIECMNENKKFAEAVDKCSEEANRCKTIEDELKYLNKYDSGYMGQAIWKCVLKDFGSLEEFGKLGKACQSCSLSIKGRPNR